MAAGQLIVSVKLVLISDLVGRNYVLSYYYTPPFPPSCCSPPLLLNPLWYPKQHLIVKGLAGEGVIR